MQQIKIFKGQEYELGTLESTVNKWLAESGRRVVQIFGNLAPRGPVTDPDVGTLSPGPYIPSEVLLVVLYEQT
jgi:hypothetical protein